MSLKGTHSRPLRVIAVGDPRSSCSRTCRKDRVNRKMCDAWQRLFFPEREMPLMVSVHELGFVWEELRNR